MSFTQARSKSRFLRRRREAPAKRRGDLTAARTDRQEW
jgi:hypothetical protein